MITRNNDRYRSARASILPSSANSGCASIHRGRHSTSLCSHCSNCTRSRGSPSSFAVYRSGQNLHKKLFKCPQRTATTPPSATVFRTSNPASLSRFAGGPGSRLPAIGRKHAPTSAIFAIAAALLSPSGTEGSSGAQMESTRSSTALIVAYIYAVPHLPSVRTAASSKQSQQNVQVDLTFSWLSQDKEWSSHLNPPSEEPVGINKTQISLS
jgi:hypothetical protein